MAPDTADRGWGPHVLDWDDDESATLRRTPYDRGSKSTDRAGEQAPPSTESAPPTLPECPRDSCMSLADWEIEVEQWELEFEQSAPPASSDEPLAGAPATIREPNRELDYRRPTLESEPPPTEASPASDADRFDLRTTTRQLVVLAPEDVDEDDAPTTAREPSVSDSLPVELTAAAPSSIPPPPPAPHLPSLAPVSLSAAPSAGAQHGELEQEIHQLRRRVRWTNRLSLAAVGCCAVLGIKLWGVSQHEAAAQLEPGLAVAPSSPPATSTEPSPTEPPPLPSTEPSPTKPPPLRQDVEVPAALSAPEPARQIEVKVRLLTPGVSLCIARHGGPAQVLAGPFPRTLQLAPGSYALLATKGGRHATVPLYLPPHRPTRDVVVRLD